MNLIGTERKDWIVEYRNSERRPWMITKSKAMALTDLMKKDSVKYIEITDDRGDFVELIEKREIKSVKDMREKGSRGETKWICDYGTHHSMSQRICRCEKRIGIHWLDFREWLRKRYDQAFNYPSDIEPHMQQDFINNYKK